MCTFGSSDKKQHYFLHYLPPSLHSHSWWPGLYEPFVWKAEETEFEGYFYTCLKCFPLVHSKGTSVSSTQPSQAASDPQATLHKKHCCFPLQKQHRPFLLYMHLPWLLPIVKLPILGVLHTLLSLHFPKHCTCHSWQPCHSSILYYTPNSDTDFHSNPNWILFLSSVSWKNKWAQGLEYYQLRYRWDVSRTQALIPIPLTERK